MAYNKINYYKTVIKVQEIVLVQKYQFGLTYKEIYYQHIEEQFNISKRTFDTYLGIPAKRELKKLEEQLKIKENESNKNLGKRTGNDQKA